MKFALFTNTVSPHQLPLAREIVKRLGPDNYRYVHTDELTGERRSLGWNVRDEPWVIPFGSGEARRWLREADVVMMQHPRDWDLFESRLARGRRCIYVSERWFKPSVGFARLLHPGYLRMAHRFVRKIMSSPYFTCLPDGIHAARDMARLCGLMHGDLRCLFRAPGLEFERRPGGRIFSRAERAGTNFGRGEVEKWRNGYCLDKMRMWGYFVEKGRGKRDEGRMGKHLRVLWVGRMLGLKRVDTIIRAVGEISTRSTRLNITLDIYGTGPEEAKLEKLAAKYGDVVRFHPPVPIDRVRELMREHDVYVMPSNAYEGWGAAVNEALEEDMKVIGTYEAGSSATMLPEECLFHAGDWRRLANLLAHPPTSQKSALNFWSVGNAADALLALS